MRLDEQSLRMYVAMRQSINATSDTNAQRALNMLLALIEERDSEIDRLREQVSRLELTMWPVKNG